MTSKIKTFTLPSGKTVVIRPGKGRDLIRANRAAGDNADDTAVVFALIAELAEIEGTRFVYEDVLEMDLCDVAALQSEVMDANFPRPAAAFPAPEPS